MNINYQGKLFNTVKWQRDKIAVKTIYTIYIVYDKKKKHSAISFKKKQPNFLFFGNLLAFSFLLVFVLCHFFHVFHIMIPTFRSTASKKGL